MVGFEPWSSHMLPLDHCDLRFVNVKIVSVLYCYILVLVMTVLFVWLAG